MIRVILCPVAEAPRVTSISPDDAGDYSAALKELLGIPAVRLPLYAGIEICCNHGGLLYGLALVRRALAMSLAEPWESESALRFDGSDPGLGLDEWPAGGDFLLARAADGGGLVDLTESDVRFLMLCLGLDYVINR